MPKYGFETNDAQELALSSVAENVPGFISHLLEHFVLGRMDYEIDRITTAYIQHCMKNNITVPATKLEALQRAFDEKFERPLAEVLAEQRAKDDAEKAAADERAKKDAEDAEKAEAIRARMAAAREKVKEVAEDVEEQINQQEKDNAG